PAKVVSTSPVELATPALLKIMTSRSLARPSRTAGSQLSRLPVKCWLKTSGSPLHLPQRRYAKRMPLASTNCVGTVAAVYVLMCDPLFAVKDDVGCFRSL